jgi:hypothetical protein
MSHLGSRIRTLALASGLGLASLGVLSLGLVAEPTAAQAQEKRERHPHIHKAITELKEAKKELEKADHDFGGHRVDAIKAADNAIKQLEKALEFDKK